METVDTASVEANWASIEAVLVRIEHARFKAQRCVDELRAEGHWAWLELGEQGFYVFALPDDAICAR
jgi:hypothetical protein